MCEGCQEIFLPKVREIPWVGGEVSQNNPGSRGKEFQLYTGSERVKKKLKIAITPSFLLEIT